MWYRNKKYKYFFLSSNIYLNFVATNDEKKTEQFSFLHQVQQFKNEATGILINMLNNANCRLMTHLHTIHNGTEI